MMAMVTLTPVAQVNDAQLRTYLCARDTAI
jgi:hypothetical protein